ncbi:MAG: hypothetical protein ACRDHD_02075 [Candidatus Limnocylindria bacterium]
MTSGKPDDTRDEAFWRDFLTRGDSMEAVKRIPTDPRCRLCAAPFAGLGAPFMRLLGKRQSEANPNMCTSCFTFLSTHHGGAEVDGVGGH